jgi:5-(carboxyamino)imidazole ribonucleotide synthase
LKIGVLGGGQLGRMTALAGYPLGLTFRFLDTGEPPVAPLAELIDGSFEDAATLDHFADGLDVVTYEFENVPVSAARYLAARLPVWPPPDALEVAQDRLSEKTLFSRLGMPVPPFAPVNTRDELARAVQALGLPAVLKTRRLGYDGKGQVILREAADLDRAWQALGSVPLILEEFVPFDRELSILAVRSTTGQTAFYPLVENEHRGGILRLSRAPMRGLAPELQARVEGYAAAVLEALSYVGVLAIEFFLVGGRVLANEMAPRVHNSGHWTIEGAESSQFENHLRAILGLPLGGTAGVGFAAMVNLIGDVPDPARLLEIPDAHLHLYGKAPRPGRKLGHVTLRAPTPALLEERLAALNAALATTPPEPR